MATKSVKNGECYYRDPDGSLWLAQSYIDENGEVTTQSLFVEDAPSDPQAA